ncbi:MAG: hypothetical protein JXB88_10960 [Spirochaetales bacterium]|nr:hypothetical protein [Spirochaetales bacterium]
MKNIFFLFCSGLILITLAGCPPPSDGGSILNVFKGTITVPDAAYWTNIKLGAFSGGDGGEYPGLDYNNNSGTVYTYRMCYYQSGDESDVSIPRVDGASSTINSSGELSRDYTFELPETLPGEAEAYFVVCFYDDNLDGNLDLKDSSDPGIITLGEYSRFPTKDTFDEEENPTTITIFYFSESVGFGGGSGNYKYTGYDDSAYNEYNELTSEYNTEIDFTITDYTAW